MWITPATRRCPRPPPLLLSRRSNEDVVSICDKMSSRSCDEIAAELTKRAVAQGSTDDVTTLVLKLK